MSDCLIVEKNNGVTFVKLNRKDLHNAFNPELIAELTQTFKSLSDDSETRVIVLSGEGPSFCAGADLNWMKSMVKYSKEENIADAKVMAKMFHTINFCKKPVIGKIHGAALGGGAGLIAVCDFVFAESNTKFGFTEAKLGLIPAVISPYVISKIGESWARAYFLSGERFDAEVALKMGLIHQVAPALEFEDKFKKILDGFLSAGPHASQIAKELTFNMMNFFKKDLIKNNWEQMENYTCEMIAGRRASSEGQEGMNALLEKRKAQWINK
jgi:methylglutaconyl-CoA hydratase